MTFLLLYAILLGVLVFAFLSAPGGHEDEDGFHRL